MSPKIQKIIFFASLDLAFITAAIFFSFLLRFDGQIPLEKNHLIFPSVILAICTAIPIFFLQKLYNISWSYASLTDIPKIVKVVLFSAALFTAALYILRTYPFFDGFPRSAVFTYSILLFIFISSFRFSKRFYWQLIKGKLPSEREWNNLITKTKPKDSLINTVLVTGGAGYIGSVLSRKLLDGRGYRVKIIDKLLFGDDSIKELYTNPNFQFIEGDIQKSSDIQKAIEDVDAVVHLAAIVGDPACAADQDTAIRTNYLATANLARACKDKGISKFIFASTCSVYGAGNNAQLTEGSVLNPVSLYAESKIYAEKELIKMTDQSFMPVIFRFATIYGLSPRMRFDLVVNLLTMKAFVEKQILIFGGNQWRPFIHVADVAQGLIKCLETFFSQINGQIFNLGASRENYLISDLGKLIQEVIPETQIEEVAKNSDTRTYNVAFGKVKQVFGFEPSRNIKMGIEEIYKALREGKFPNTQDPKYYNHKQA